MSDIISAGAYVIRNKKTSAVLHIENPDMHVKWSPILAHDQAENQYHNQQIWWIEPLVNGEDSDGKKGSIYSISSPASGGHLGGQDDGKIIVCERNGGPWQWWKFRRAHECKDGVYYYIVTTRDQGASIKSEGTKLVVRNQDLTPGSEEFYWELVIPATGYPPGWIHIKSANTGGLLSHIYLYDPPVLLPSPDSLSSSQYHDVWHFQWTIANSAGWHSISIPGGGANSWAIKNRLTGATLVNNTWCVPGARLDNVNAWNLGKPNSTDSMWKLELDRSHNWKIVNLNTNFLLQQTDVPRSGGMQVVCMDKAFSLKEGTKSWILSSPTLETNDESPPDYEA